ncbi:hypothetical protein DSM19430T_31180 [Desulfovibrio psychrotolerans]|uniref:DUF1653 domain-containing protein n=2 Tax=Desulfovibrio psychrotolerans TaxID=415242 RepID=A0A7J0BZQ5_9BACT|nr:hypothetical protein DSM19430T_31180 [Desulfovibrio psychrotolerans]
MGSYYRHFKGRYYQVVGEALDTSTDSPVVVYRTLYPSQYSLVTRPAEEFFGEVLLADGTRTARFSPVNASDLPEDAARYACDRPFDFPVSGAGGVR